MTRRPISHPPVAQQAEGSDVEVMACDVAIIGGGIAGLSVALSLPSDLRVVLVTKNALGESNTRYAQGGLAAPVGPDDSPEFHLSDTLAAGAGLVYESAARILVTEAREAVGWLIEAGTRFDEHSQLGQNGRRLEVSGESANRFDHYDLAREAAHSRRRVLHARGDATGAEIEHALVQAIRRHPATCILENTIALELLAAGGICTGVELWCMDSCLRIMARYGVVLANGGAGQLWKRTSNPLGATADGLALALRAGAALADLEFVQFHPTVLVPPQETDEPFLVSEAVRGEGAYLRNAAGERFMLRYHPDAELAPRDIVARAIQSELKAAGTATAYLDLRHLPESEIRQRFPTIGTACFHYGFDLAHDLIPVAPAAHYFMGGVAVDTYARTTIPQLYAVGETACTGVHGANRLASNSLLEGLVFGRRAAQAIAEADITTVHWPQKPVLPGEMAHLMDLVSPQVAPTLPLATLTRATLRTVMWEKVSLSRDAAGLQNAQNRLRQLASSGLVDPETANMLVVAQAITACALLRTESRGGHYRTDYPASDPRCAGQHTLALAEPNAAGDQLCEGRASYVHA